jgi:hypothetical protein
MTDIFPAGIKSGKINYSNFLKRLSDLGFNNANCINELIDNAIDAGAQNVNIHLRIKTCEGSAPQYFIEIVDDGSGMDEYSFAKYFEMFGDKDDATLQSLGKKGIGGKAALVTLSKLGETLVVSKKSDSGLLYTNVSWSKLTENNICISHASRAVEDLWDEYQLRQGTIARVYLDAHTYEELDELIDERYIDERNVYYTACRNYFRHLQDGLNITFTKKVNTEHQVISKCKPLDPLYLDKIEHDVCKGQDILRLYTNPLQSDRPELLVKDANSWVGFTHNKRCGNKMTHWSSDDVKDLNFIAELVLEHSHIVFDDEKKDSQSKKQLQTKKEKHILKEMFPKAGYSKDSILSLTGGTHLERNKKETGLLLNPQQKKTGDFDKREFVNQSRHRLIFESTSNNEDIIDKIIGTQINKSKIDINEMPNVIKKTIEKLNEAFARRIYDVVTHDANDKPQMIQPTHNIAGNDMKADEPKMMLPSSSKNLVMIDNDKQKPTLVSAKDLATKLKHHALVTPKPMNVVTSHPVVTVQTLEPDLQQQLQTENVKNNLEVQTDVKTLKGVSEKMLFTQLLKLTELVKLKGRTKVEQLCCEDCQQDLILVYKTLEMFNDKLQRI